jgi:N-acyl amino acid synthase of PEP-CTERM/exosortase system
MLLLKWLTRERDVLIPYFKFHAGVPGGVESAMLEEIYRLRYEVYCLERKFLSADDFPDGLESDEYDPCSTQIAAYNLDDVIVGSVRLVQPTPSLQFPFEAHCKVFEDYKFPSREASGEISRLVVRKNYRRRRGDTLQGISKDFMDKGTAKSIKPHPGGTRRSGDSPLLLLGMYREMYRYSRRVGIRYWYAAMERSLARALGKMGFQFKPIGPQTDYYGPVSPFLLDLDEVDANLRNENKFLAAWFNDEPIPVWLLCRTIAHSLIQKR